MKDKLYHKINEVLLDWGNNNPESKAADDFASVIGKTVKASLKPALRFKLEGSNEWIEVNKGNSEKFIYPYYGKALSDFPYNDLLEKDVHLIINNSEYWSETANNTVSIYCCGNVTEIEILNLEALKQIFPAQPRGLRKLNILINQYYTHTVRFKCETIDIDYYYMDIDIDSFWSEYYTPSTGNKTLLKTLYIDCSQFKQLYAHIYFSSSMKYLQSAIYIPSNDVYTTSNYLIDQGSQQIATRNWNNLNVELSNLNNSVIKICNYGDIKEFKEIFDCHINKMTQGEDSVLYFYISECSDDIKNKLADFLDPDYNGTYYKEYFMEYIIKNDLWKHCKKIIWYMSSCLPVSAHNGLLYTWIPKDSNDISIIWKSPEDFLGYNAGNTYDEKYGKIFVEQYY